MKSLALVILAFALVVARRRESARWQEAFIEDCSYGYGYCDKDDECVYGSIERMCCNGACRSRERLAWGAPCDNDDDDCEARCPEYSKCDEDYYGTKRCTGRVGMGCPCEDREQCGEGEDVECNNGLCMQLYKGNGQQCMNYLECASQVCTPDSSTGKAYCAAVGAGAQCQQNNKNYYSVPCVDGYYCSGNICVIRGGEFVECDGDIPLECAEGYYCHQQLEYCTPRLPAGSACNVNQQNRRKDNRGFNPCQSGLFCHLNICVSPASVPEGGKCQSTRACVPGTFCGINVDDRQGGGGGGQNAYNYAYCRVPHSLAVGSPCSFTFECPTGSYCDGYACTASIVGAACDEAEDCYAGLVCACGMCAVDKAYQHMETCLASLPQLLAPLNAQNQQNNNKNRLRPAQFTAEQKAAYIQWRCCIGCSERNPSWGKKDTVTLASEAFQVPWNLYRANQNNNNNNEDSFLEVAGGYTFNCHAKTMEPVQYACATAVASASSDPVAITLCDWEVTSSPTYAPAPNHDTAVDQGSNHNNKNQGGESTVAEAEPSGGGAVVVTIILAVLVAAVVVACFWFSPKREDNAPLATEVIEGYGANDDDDAGRA